MERKLTKVTQRKDGLVVFPDGDEQLDMIRLCEKDRRKVILSVAFRRFQQIAMNYASKYAPDIKSEINLIVNNAGTKQVKKNISQKFLSRLK